MRNHLLALVVTVAAAVTLAGCDKARPVPTTTVVSTSCTGCHGGVDNDTGAPPRDTKGQVATTAITVGAHTAHVNAGLDCDACHVKPARVVDPGHINGQATVTFGALAKLGGGVAPVFNPATGTCSNVYCHGAKLPVGAQGEGTTPAWTGNPPSLAGAPCGSCHGSAATNGAPQGHGAGLGLTDCSTCHPETVLANGTIKPAADGGLHADGHVQFSAGACTGCHGDANRSESDSLVAAAPPKDTAGLTSGAKVGAHLRHVSTAPGLGSRLSKPFACAECHAVPTTVPHNAAAVVQFATAAGTLAKGPTGALSPAYAAGSGSCSATYCHGATLVGGSSKTPSWTGTAGCGTCHFLSTPPAPHPSTDRGGVPITVATQCIQCHPGTVLANGDINVANGLHVNGVKDVDYHPAGFAAPAVHGGPAKLDLAACQACHGADFNGTPASNNVSCNACHGGTGWQQRCTLCHGEPNRAPVAGQPDVGSPPVNAALAAPPLGSQDESAAGDNAVGAHLAHVQPGPLAGAFVCQQCHGSPLPSDLGHVNGQVKIGWQLATLGGAVAATPAAGTIPRASAVSCANYCHGASLGGGTKKDAGGAAVPVSWTGGAAEAACGTCHALPPPYAAPSWHVANAAATACVTCHGFDSTAMNRTLHVNGTVDVAASVTCFSCHGTQTSGNFAPPRSASADATATTNPRVGAHQAHLKAGPLAGAFACTDCHGTLPTAMNHADGKVTLAWSSLASAAGALSPTPTAGSATSPGTTATCANYCHGQKWEGNASFAGSHAQPSWTGTTAAEVACGACHKVAPTGGSHTSVSATTNCSNCHAGYDCTQASLSTCTVNVTTHVNGKADLGNQTCSSCHGAAGRTIAAGTLGPVESANNLAAVPPADSQGQASSVRVGPHQGHVNPAAAGGQLFKPVACAECHTSAVATYTTGHSNGVTNVAFTNATSANLGGVVPSWIPGTPSTVTPPNPGTPDTCVTYCHGASLSPAQKGSVATWQWDTTTTVNCGSCHGLPPNDLAHTTVPKPSLATACNACHSTVVNAAGGIVFAGTGTAATTLHINGARNPNTTCHSCHGSATNDAPPVATSTTNAAVKAGGHQKHVTATTLRSAVLACTECHPNNTTQNHASGVVDLPYGTLAKTGGLVPTPSNLGPATVPTQATWEAAPNCTNYCHGQKWIGNATYAGSRTSPAWTDTTAVAAACGSCHKAPPSSSAHASVTATKNCQDCHAGYNCTTGNLAGCTVNKTVHINGVADVSGQTCSSCHGTAGRTLAGTTLGPVQVNANNVIAFPPVDTSGASTGTKVGAHAGHVNPAAPGPQIYKPVLCSECHTTAVDTYTTAHPNGVSNVAFTNATGANLGGVIPSWTAGAPSTCVTYCHGASLTAGQKGTITTWQWNTGITTACNSCHGTAPNDPVHTSVSKTAPVTACNPCHSTVVNAAGAIIFTGTGTAATTLHMNGVRNPTTTCHSCHGSATNDAPPVATNGTSTGVKVGAHQRHVTATTLRSAVLACADCHVLNTTQNHASGVVDLPYGTLAKTGGLVPTPSNLGPATVPTQATWEAAPNCTNYCHGQKWIGNATYAGSRTSPAWIDTTAVAAACGSCHLAPPSSSAHASVTATKNCGDCHTGYNCTTGNLAGCTVNKTVHINGGADVSGQTCSSCHGTAGRTLAGTTLGPVQVNANNVIAFPPTDTAGASTGTKVGAHAGHVNPAAPGPQIYKPVLCSECHTSAVDTYTTAHPNGVTNVAFTNATGANLGGVIPSWTAGAPSTCVTYCHGASLTAGQKGTITTWQWNTGITTACNSCHGTAPNDPVHTSVSKTAPVTACNPCHNTVVNAAGAIIFTGTGTAATTLHMNGVRNPTTTCHSCHGTATNDAPPVATNGTSTGVKVGAHQKHVTATTLRSAVLACADCHVLNTTQNHASGVVDLPYGTLAKTGGLVPTPSNLGPATVPTQATWEAAPNCTNYCHGQKWIGNATYAGSRTSPAWTDTAAVAAACGSCHLAPPSSSAHASVTATKNCGDCHTGYNCTTGNLAGCTVNKTVHINGVADVSGQTCSSCHGTAGRTLAGTTLGPVQVNANNVIAFPPNDSAGASTGTKVGAHAGHVNPAAPGPQIYKPVLCSECHTSAVDTYTTAHPNGVTNVAFTNATGANLGGVIPSWTAGAPSTCVTYCHGASLTAGQKGTITTWQWNTGITTACNSCHGTAPNDPVHTSVSKTAPVTACNPCHNTVVNAAGAIIFTGTGTAATTLHMNGVRNPTTTCHSCHGSATNDAPPVATNGTSTGVKVGAHQKHVTATTLRSAVLACADCHVLNTTQNHASGVVDLPYGTLAKTGGLVPTPSNLGPATVPTQATWEAAPNCTNYCHGQKWIGNATYAGSRTSPAWTDTAAVAAACGSCHLAPPSSSAHASVTATKNCGDCHTGYNCTTGNLAGCTVNKTVHINGVADANGLSCTSCHGTAGRTTTVGTLGPVQVNANNLVAFPPLDTASASTGTKVGAHVGHALPTPASQIYKPVLCSECHTSAVDTYTTAHPNGVTNVAFTSATGANLGGVVPSWTAGAPSTCVTYCHGASLTAGQKGTITTWQWNTGITTACNSCHGTAPNDPVHTSVSKTAPVTACNPCHNTVVSAAGAIIFTGTGTAATTLHMNGVRNPTTTCHSCHGTATNDAPPVATNGTSTGVKVGAHQKHVAATTLRSAVLACADCHVLNTTQNHASGVVDLPYGTLAKTGGLVPTPSNLGPATVPTQATWEAAPNCTNYCHGQKWIGNATYAGSRTSPAWTDTTAVAAACGSCHLAPPTSSAHASVTATKNCGDCHSGYSCTTGNLAGCTVNKTVHINGVADANGLSCTSCHGTAGRTTTVGTLGPVQVNANNLIAFPPLDTASASTGTKVGAHVGHALPTPASQIYKPVLCSECHTSAVDTYTTAHPNGVTNVAFTNATGANLGGVIPSWTAGAPSTCVTYCHGASLTAGQKGTITTWQWNTGITTACNSCHGTAPNDPVHTSVSKTAPVTACNPCHNTVVSAAGAIIFTGTGTAATTLHMNGVRNPTTTCHSCHGSVTNDAPPLATNGSTSGVKVGAHQKHVAATTLRSAVLACADCHVLNTTQNHASGVVDLPYGTLAKTGGLVPTPSNLGPATVPTQATWEATPNCTNYCHGQKWIGNATYAGSRTSPAWTDTAAVAAACGSCHLAPPTSSAHASVTATKNCGDCHTGYSCTTGNLAGCTVNKTTHINGVADASGLTCASCHGTTGRTTTVGTLGPVQVNANNLIAFPPLDTASASTGTKVGAHVGHALPTPASQIYKPVLCSECHTSAVDTYTTAHPNGVTNVAFTNATGANLGGVVPSWTAGAPSTCVTYCHGASLTAGQKGTITTWQWNTGITTACNSCHGTAPNDPVHTSVSKTAPVTACNPCHNTVVNAAGAIIFTGTGTAATTLHMNGVRNPTTTCHSCHGSVTNDAPPVATNGTSTGVKVGAHQRHVTATTLRSAVLACADCHVLNTTQNHASGVVDLPYGTLAKTGGLVPTPSNLGPATVPTQATWEAAPNCTNYCHGQKWIGNATYAGSRTSPAWTDTTAVAAACGSCHLAPPTSSAHASVTATKNCGDCHTGYSCTTGNLAGCTVNKTTHINGVADASGLTCASCHGTTGRTTTVGTLGPVQVNANNLIAFPPLDTASASTGTKVGAHVGHALPTPASQIYKPVLCSECHTSAVDTYTTAHPNGVTNVAFTNATGANLGGVIPSWTAGAPSTCVTYCHGASLTAGQKGTITTWQWNTGITTACNSCHGTAPNDPVHTSVSKTAPVTACNPCHNTVVSAAGAIIFTGTGTAATTLHMNGVRNPTTTCHSCHGSATNDAPPVATNGTSTGVKVGAHQKHVTATTLRAATLACTECHPLNAAQNHASGIVDLPYNTLAKTGGLVPTPSNLGPATVPTQATWEATPTCTNYCHGQKWIGNATYAGSRTSPAWTDTTAVAAACGSCHKAPPSSTGHASVTATKNCGDCHTGYNCTTGNLAGCTVNKTTHINGTLDAVSLTCSSCHGTAGRTLAGTTLGPVQVNANNVIAFPPVDTAGASTGTKVGAHAGHVNPAAPGPQIYKPVLCSECHTSAVDTYTTAHPNGVTNVAFTNATGANLGGVIPSWTAGAPSTCVTYCHGASLTAGQKGTITTWQWNTGITAACNSCHGTAPNDPVHTSVSKTAPVTACNPCHNTVVNAAGAIIFTGTGTAATTLHMNGVRNPTTTCHSCHGSATNDAPPVATNGTSTGVKVGAHQKHVTATTLRAATLACTECHPLNAAQNHASGIVDLPYNTLAKTGGLVPTPSNLGPATVPTQATWEATPTCTNYCHGQKWIGNATYAGSRTSPAWTDTTAVAAACGSCHKAPPSSTGHASVTATKNCADCHGAAYNCTTATLATCAVDKTLHINGVVDVPAMTCSSCHGTAGRVQTAGTRGPVQVSANNLIAVPPLDSLGASTGTKVGAHVSHVDPQSQGSQLFKPVLCSECHTTAVNTYTTAHANGVTNVAFTNATSANLGGVTPSWTAGAPSTCVTYCHGASFTAVQKGAITTWQWNTGIAVACNSCHGLPPDPTGTHAGVTATATACVACHAGTVDATGAIVWNGTGTAATTLHINGAVDGGESNGNDKCWSCHKTDAGGRNYQAMQADTATYHHVLTADNNTTGTPAVTSYPTTAAAKTCASCHADHNVFVPTINTANTQGRGANLRVSGLASAPPAVADGTNPNQAPGTTYTNTDYAASAGVCISCHTAAQTKSTTAQKSTGETTTHVVNGTGYSTSAHQYAVAGQITSGASAFQANCMKCHADAPVAATYPQYQSGAAKFTMHTSVDRRHRNPMGMTAPADNMEEKFCFRCHSTSADVSPGGGPAKTVANRDYFNSAPMSAGSQNLFATFGDATHTAKHNVTAYSGLHQPNEDQARISANKHVECEDCHDPHGTKAGAKAATNQNTVWGPLTGVPGVSATFNATANWTAPTYAAVTASTFEYQICFKCHSAANTALATWNANWTNLGLEFSTGNQSRHPVAAALPATDPSTTYGSSQLAAKQLINGWTPGMVMTCSDCHGADAAAPAAQGPHGSAVTFMLKGTNRAWPYTVAGANTGTLFAMNNTGTGAGTANGLFCRNCHGDPNGGTTVTNAGHAQFAGQHGSGSGVNKCVQCHIRVPHGGKVSRLILTNLAPARYITTGATPNFVRFIKNNTGAYSGNSWFGTTCAEHSGGASGGEAW